MFRFHITNNKSGITFLDTLVALVIFLTVVLFIGKFQIFLKTSTISLDKKVVFLQTVNNEINNTYSTDDWVNLSGKTVQTDFGDINVTYSGYTPTTPALTNKITIKFDFGGNIEQYDLERSVYYDE